MTDKFETNKINIIRDHGYIVLYQRSDHKNPKWQTRIKIDHSKGYSRASTKTLDIDKARRFAEDLYESLYDKYRATGSTQLRSFKAVVDLWLAHIEDQGMDPEKIQEHKNRLYNYPVIHWSGKYIDQIQAPDLVRFVAWRKTAGRKKAQTSLATIKRDIVPLKQVFNYAFGEKFISEPLSFKRMPVPTNPRPVFHEDEWNQVVSKIGSWVLAVKDSNQRHYRDRMYLGFYIQILGYSGIRPGKEASSITWNSLNYEHFRNKAAHAWVIYVQSGKSGKRAVVGDTNLNQTIRELKQFRLAETQRRKIDFNDDEPIFCHEDGTAIQSFGKGFTSFLTHYGLLKDDAGDCRIPYSLRHTYATRLIDYGVNHWDIARNMGTSVALLEKTYVHGNYKKYGANVLNAIPQDNRMSAANTSFPFETPTPIVTLTPTPIPTPTPTPTPTV